MDKKTVGLIIVVACVSVLLGVVVSPMLYSHVLNLHGRVGVDMETSSVHCRITIYEGETLILDQYHSGVVTDIGDNMTLFWIFGDTDMQYADLLYTQNATFISIGDQGSLSSASTVLPGEWNRTAATVEDEIQSALNLTCTFYPDDAGPYTADCIGINLNVTASANNLIFYDTFDEVTNIDETFTINVEFKVSVAHT
jgi:hypothetical protein